MEGSAEAVSSLSAEECHRQIQRILQSVSFRNSVTLQQLLRFLAARTLQGSQKEPLKEYTIGVEAFGRAEDFDPKTDTIVRVQIHRLRQKLKEYYDSEGSRDLIYIEIPKGDYHPHFESLATHVLAPSTAPGSNADGDLRSTSTPGNLPGTLTSFSAPTPLRKQVRIRRFFRITLPAGFAVALFSLGFWLGTRQQKEKPTVQTIQDYRNGTDAVKAFWANLIGDDTAPVIAYPDAVFLLDNSNDLFRFRQGASDDRGALVDPHLARQFASNPTLVSEAGVLYYDNGYTGAGELQAVGMLASLFGQMGVQPIFKPSREITPADLRQHSVILLGSSFQNVAVAQLMNVGDLVFKNPDSRLEGWRAEIQNAHPQPGEQASYHTERDPVTHTLTMDYGVVSVQPGVVPGRHIVMLGGLDTTGTEGATMFATSQTGAETLLKATGLISDHGAATEMQPFQVLVKVPLEKGYGVLGVTLAAVHKTLKVANPQGVINTPEPAPAH
ncbi:MAG: hypothetical protein JSS95_06695 [Acidobacteria bacterium]|nr:hypothetical protein [Acidobacteriota bacterium]